MHPFQPEVVRLKTEAVLGVLFVPKLALPMHPF
jgi:hypothetical protein